MAKTENTIESLLKLVSSGKATASDKIELAGLLNNSAKEESAKEFNEKIEKIKAFIAELGLDNDDVAKALKAPPVLIFQWGEFKRYSGELGKLPKWTEMLKEAVPEEKEALKLVVNKNEKGITFVKNLYK